MDQCNHRPDARLGRHTLHSSSARQARYVVGRRDRCCNLYLRCTICLLFTARQSRHFGIGLGHRDGSELCELEPICNRQHQGTDVQLLTVGISDDNPVQLATKECQSTTRTQRHSTFSDYCRCGRHTRIRRAHVRCSSLQFYGAVQHGTDRWGLGDPFRNQFRERSVHPYCIVGWCGRVLHDRLVLIFYGCLPAIRKHTVAWHEVLWHSHGFCRCRNSEENILVRCSRCVEPCG